MALTTTASEPLTRPSDEADEQQLQQARAEGQAYLTSLNYMANEVADTGGKKRAGEYLVGFAQERAEGMYHLRDGGLTWLEPEDENCHIEVAVVDAADHRFIPYLDIEVTVLDAEGTEVTTFEPQFLWHPGLYHYGKDIKLPGDGTYTLQIKIAPPSFPRHDEVNGKRYAEPVDVTFENVQIKTGRE